MKPERETQWTSEQQRKQARLESELAKALATLGDHYVFSAARRLCRGDQALMCETHHRTNDVERRIAPRRNTTRAVHPTLRAVERILNNQRELPDRRCAIVRSSNCERAAEIEAQQPQYEGE